MRIGTDLVVFALVVAGSALLALAALDWLQYQDFLVSFASHG